MGAATPNSFAPLLHAVAMMFFPAIMGLSTSLCLRSRPSPFSTVAVHEYLGLTRWLDRLWLLAMLVWLVLAVSRTAGASAAALLALFLVGAHFWFQSVLAAELATVAERVAASGDLTTVSVDGVCIAERRRSDGTLRFHSAELGVKLYSFACIAALGVFVAAMVSALGRPSGPSVAQCVLLAGIYLSLGVFLVDLCADVLPGFTTDERVKRASRYYVQVFEDWKNLGVVAGFLTVLIGAPYVFSRGEAPFAVMSFPIWIGTCLCFATFFNQVLHRADMVKSRLPLPVWVNVYSLRYPLWAHFFAVIHVIMAIALVVGLLVLGI